MKKLLLTSIAFLTLTSLIGCDNSNNSSNLSTNSNSVSEFIPQEDDKIHLIILAGQSGARGKALVNDLTTQQKKTNKDVEIVADGLVMEALDNIPDYLSDTVEFKDLGIGYGDYPSELGPEIGMGETLASRYQKGSSNHKSVIIKYTACGSTFTDHWFSESLYNDDDLSLYLNLDQVRKTKNDDFVGPLTKNLYELIDYTVTTLIDEGYEVTFDGAAFVHGEQDAKFEDNMIIFEKALSYFINDLRAYINDFNMPFVITEALTNSAKYSNDLKTIQRKVAGNLNNVILIDNSNLYTNTFEPWHFGAQSNILLGNKIAAELISYNDTRYIDTIDEDTLNVPFGTLINLPKYLNATFDNGYTGYFKINEYTKMYDPNIEGEQEVYFTSMSNEGLVENSYLVNVSKNVSYIDGTLNEYNNSKKNSFDNNLGHVNVIKGTKGLYVSADINDSLVYTNGEKWHEGDMGQKEQNDDFRIYVTTSNAKERMTLCLSSANLFRVYGKGISLNDEDSSLINNNLVYKKQLKDFDYRVVTKGYVNDENIDSKGLVLELYISYNDLGVTNPDLLKLCFNYNNISFENGKVNKNNYLVKDNSLNNNLEEYDSSYFSINELI